MTVRKPAALRRACDSCGERYSYQRPTSKFCSSRCRVRGARGVVVDLPKQGSATERGPVGAAVFVELEAAKQDASALGRMALAMATKVDAGRETGTALATLTRELRSTLDVVLARGVKATDRVDELRARREAMARGA